jgi:hypothetical protein
MTVFSFQEVSAAPSSHETGRVSTAVEKERPLRTSDQIAPPFSMVMAGSGRSGGPLFLRS